MNKYKKRNIALLFGIMIGDGCLSRYGNSYCISISGHKFDDKLFFNIIKKSLKN